MTGPINIPTSPTTVYRLYDADDQLLYIGIGGNPGRRFNQHAGDKPWWGTVTHIELEHHPTREAALDAERQAILEEHPLYNIIHNTHRSPDPVVTYHCHSCGHPIADNTGYLEVDLNDVFRTKKARKDWEAKYADRQTGAIAVSGGELMTYPRSTPWYAWHQECDDAPEHQSYWFGVERIRTLSQVLHWTSHLMEKDWLEYTNWNHVIGLIAAASRYGHPTSDDDE